MKWLLLIQFFLLALPGFTAEAQEQPGASGATKSPQTVLFIGDSLSAGFGVLPAQAFPELIARKLKSLGRETKVVNASISGSVSADADRRLEWHLKHRHVDVLVLELGANDALKGTAVAVIRKNLKAVVVLAKKSKLKVLLLGMKIFTNLGDDYGREFERMYQEIAHEEKVSLMPFFMEAVALKPNLMQADQKHPNAEGHQILAEKVQVFLERLL